MLMMVVVVLLETCEITSRQQSRTRMRLSTYLVGVTFHEMRTRLVRPVQTAGLNVPVEIEENEGRIGVSE